MFVHELWNQRMQVCNIIVEFRNVVAYLNGRSGLVTNQMTRWPVLAVTQQYVTIYFIIYAFPLGLWWNDTHNKKGSGRLWQWEKLHVTRRSKAPEVKKIGSHIVSIFAEHFLILIYNLPLEFLETQNGSFSIWVACRQGIFWEENLVSIGDLFFHKLSSNTKWIWKNQIFKMGWKWHFHVFYEFLDATTWITLPTAWRTRCKKSSLFHP
jgi:hypothetical protein